MGILDCCKSRILRNVACSFMTLLPLFWPRPAATGRRLSGAQQIIFPGEVGRRQRTSKRKSNTGGGLGLGGILKRKRGIRSDKGKNNFRYENLHKNDSFFLNFCKLLKIIIIGNILHSYSARFCFDVLIQTEVQKKIRIIQSFIAAAWIADTSLPFAAFKSPILLPYSIGREQQKME